MRTAIQYQNPAVQAATAVSVPAPVGGWNARDGMADMPITDAIIMRNWFPETSYVATRKGSSTYMSGLGTNQVQSLMAYAGNTGLQLFCATLGQIYNITTVQALGTINPSSTVAPAAGAFGGSQWQYINMGTAGGKFLVACNGVDKQAQKYDGTSWAALAPTWGSGATITFSNVATYQRRLFFTEKGTLRFAYCKNPAAITGTINPFDLSALFDQGGYLVAMATWTQSGGSGVGSTDSIGFITSQGQVAVYYGIDPGNANDWGMVGVYNMPRILSPRAAIKFGSDIAIATENGVVPLSSIVTGVAQQESYVSDKIRLAVSSAVNIYRNNFGWELCYFRAGHKLLLNVPIRPGIQCEQYVMNTNTGSWSDFSGWNANCFCNYNNQLFAGIQGGVIQVDTGNGDSGTNVNVDVEQAASFFGVPGRNKSFTMMRPQIGTDSTFPLAVGIDTDFSSVVPTNIPSPVGLPVSAWNVSLWNTFYWALGVYSIAQWQGLSGTGTYGSARITGAVLSQNIQWYATDIVFEPGAIV